ncbi:hypothetical protein Tco_0511173 [Tanacetum coccineum]
MDSVEKAIAERGLYKRTHDNRVNERTMQTQEGMANLIVKESSETKLAKQVVSSRAGNDTYTKDGKISKDASEIGNNVAGASHDKDNITKAFKQEEDKYVNNIIQLEAKNKDLKNTVCKMGKSSQILRMLTNEQSLYQENKRKMGLGYTDPCPLGQAIACHLKLYDAEVLGLHYVQPDVHDTEEILNDAEESQVKMKEKQFQFNYENINSLYDTFVPQTELSPEQEYFSDPSTSNVSSESSKEMSDLPTPKMPKESKLLKMFHKKDDAILALQNNIDITFLEDSNRRWISDSQNTLRQFYKTDVIPMLLSLMKSSKELQQELIEEVQVMLNIFESMESRVDQTSKKNEILQNKIDQLLEANIANDVKDIVMQSYVEIKNKEEIEWFSKESKDVDKFCNDDVEVKEKFSRIETTPCDEVKIKVDMDKIETQNIELEHQVASLIKKNEHLKLVYKNLFDSIKKSRVQIQSSNVTHNEKENLRSTLSEFAIDHILGKDDSSLSSIAESHISELEKESGENICENAKSKFEAYFEKLENTKVVRERQLAHKVDDFKAEKDQFLKEINHVRTQLENLKGKYVETMFDKPSILGKPHVDKLLINSQSSKSWFAPKVVVQKDLSKPVTTQSLPRNEKDQLLK